MTPGLVLLGAGGLARETLEAVRAAGDIEVRGLLDDDPRLVDRLVGGVPVMGAITDLGRFPATRVVACLGRGSTRRGVLAAVANLRPHGAGLVSVVHPTCSVGRTCRVGTGSILLAHTTLTADVDLGTSVVVMPGAVLTHDVQVSDYATICAGVLLAGGVQVGAGAYLGAGCSVRQGVSVGAESVVGMGSVVLQDVPAGETWTGVPARPIRRASGTDVL